MKITDVLITILYEESIREINDIILEQEQQNIRELSDETKKQIQEIGGLFGRGYARWIIIRLMDKSLKEEDIYKYKQFFKYFEEGKKLGHFKENDILKYKNPIVFEKEVIKSHEAITRYQGNELVNTKNYVSISQIQQLEKTGIKFLGITANGYQVFKIPKGLGKNQEAFQAQKSLLGRCKGRQSGEGISICTMGNISHFNNYLSTDDLYVFFNLNDDLSPYQFHYASNSFMDKNDHSIV